MGFKIQLPFFLSNRKLLNVSSFLFESLNITVFLRIEDSVIGLLSKYYMKNRALYKNADAILSFIKQIFIECVLCARSCARRWLYHSELR